MTLNQLVWDIKTIAEQVGSESDLGYSYLVHKINMYRRNEMINFLIQNRYLDSKFYQSIGELNMTKVNSSDDADILVTNVYLGRYEIPEIIELRDNIEDNLGIKNLMSKGRETFYKEINIERFAMMIDLNRPIDRNNGYYYIFNKRLYIYPYNTIITGDFLLSDPSDGKILTSGTWTDFDKDNEYPIPLHSAQNIILQILTNDFQILKQQISDIVNDSKNELKVMKTIQ